MFDMIPNRKKVRDFFDFDNFFSEFVPDHFINNDNKMMRLDIKEIEHAYIFHVEMPGVKKEDINLVINDDILTINVKREHETTEEEGHYIRKERKYGAMSRSFSIPNIDRQNIKAHYENGILNLHLPKRTETSTEQHKIVIE